VQVQQVIMVDRPIEQVFDYISDFTTSSQWDPGTSVCRQVAGDGGEGTEYTKTWQRPGRRHGVDVRLVVTEYVPNRVFALHGSAGLVDSLLRFTVRPATAGPGRSCTRLTFTGDYAFRGPVRLLGPMLTRILKRASDAVQVGLEDALLRLPTNEEARKVG
jgi:carbon monoxide dehydrogenase subunit G